MTKEIYISSTPHETRLAVVEDDQLAEIYYERENEYTLAGSVYKGKVTRVLPGMQSAFVDIGLERDAFLYVTDFAEEQEDGEDYIPLSQGRAAQPRTQGNGHQVASNEQAEPSSQPQQKTANPPRESGNAEPSEDGGSRRWRGRRGRRRGRGNAQQGKSSAASENASDEQTFPADQHPQAIEFELGEIGDPGIESEFLTEHSFTDQHAEPQIEHPSEPFSHNQPDHASATQSHQPVQSHQPTETSPLVLPGESLSKYRRGSAPSESSERQASIPAVPVQPATPVPTFQPSTMVTAPLAWDGGDLLPGESLSRRKNKPAPTEPQPTSSLAAEIDAPAHSSSEIASEPVVEVVGYESLDRHSTGPEPDRTFHEHALTEHPLGQHPLSPEEISSHADTPRNAVEGAVDRSAMLSSRPDSERSEGGVEGPAVSENSEPEEASASYRFDPAAPSAYRQSSVAEPPEVEPPVEEPLAEATSLEDIFPPAEQEIQSATENAEQEVSGESESTSEQDTHIFNPGLGNLEEETIDEEEAEIYTAQALEDEEGYDDLVEETLDVQMDSGLLSELVRDQHIDERTGYSEDHGHVPGYEDDSLDEEVSFDEEHSGIELEEISDTDQDEESEDPDVANADATQPRPDGRRNNRRGARNQRSGHGGNRGGRMRRSTAQTTNLPAITELLKPNQEILVQIAKEPIARKGARITSHIALPGRFLVFMPTVNHVGVSRKISSDEERQRLKHILLSEKGEASGGFIVRTAAATASEEDLRADIRFLLTLWAEIKQRADSSKPPALIYHDLSLVERVLRDQVTDNFSAIWVDSEADYERVLRFLNRFEPALVRRVKLYTKETPLFEQFGIQEEINKALRSKVWLKSGGSIVINQTEALVAIDINTGKYVGKTARLEDTILKTNLDAIPEIVRQIRLRDLGGIIVIDFIDMDERKNRNKVMLALEDALKSDRAPSKVLQFNDFGLVAITRKRVKQSLERTLSVPCSVCTGTGMVKGPLTVCNEIYIELRKMHRQFDRGDIMLRVNPEVVKQLKASNGRWLSEMEEMSGKTIIVKSDAALHPEQFDIH